MEDYQRARSKSQKAERMAAIKATAEALFATEPYHAITMSKIADKLGWTRTKLYTYAATKEEIYLEICGNKRVRYYAELVIASDNWPLTHEELAEIWAAVLDEDRDFLRYAAILPAILETNVSAERLAAFKKSYYLDTEDLCMRLGAAIGADAAVLVKLMPGIHSYATGLCASCTESPLMREALALANITPAPVDFKAELQDYLRMTLAWHCR